MLAANFLDDGKRLWLIDWDYAGFNTPLFDLGGLASNNAFSEDAERAMLEAYYQRPADAGSLAALPGDEMRLAAARDALEHGVGNPLHHRLRLCRLYRREPRAFRARLYAFEQDNNMTKELPRTAKAVVIGGGIIGCSTAYHLGKLGWTDTVLLERKKLTSGTTFHAAGLVGQLRTSANITQLLGYSVDLYKRLEAETGLGTGWKMNGGLRLACNEERWTEVKRQATTAQSFGLDMQLLTPQEAFDLWPLMTIDDLVGAAFLPTDGQANPSDITQALARGARMPASIFEDTEVIDLEIDKGRIRAVITEHGRIECERVVVCAGQWTRAFAARFGVNVPLVSVEHQYIITESFGVPSNLPTLRDPDRLTYYKEEVGGIVMGGYEPNPIAWAKSGIPEGFHYSLLDSNFDHFEQIMEQALGRVPALENVGVKQLLNGPESFTPDGNFILGEAPELRTSSSAPASTPSASPRPAAPAWRWPNGSPRASRPTTSGRSISAASAARISTPTGCAPARWRPMASTTRWPWPFEEYASGRPCRKSPLYDRLKAQGACFGEKLGWERPNWFADLFANEEPKDIYSYGRQNWFDAVGREHKAVREAAVIFDQTSFAKFTLKGRDAEAALSWIAANDVARPVGSLVYTQMLNDKGGIECDVTCARIAEDEYYIVTGTGFATHDFDWIARNIPGDMHAELVDVTSPIRCWR
jgi:sarcosine dehydrogenase